MEPAVQSESGTNGAGCPVPAVRAPAATKSAVQKRIDKLTRDKFEALADLGRALDLVERYKQALRKAVQALRKARKINAE